MLGHKEARERKGVVVKELKCGWPSEFETFRKIKCFLCQLRQGLLKAHVMPGFKLRKSLHYILLTLTS